MAVTFTTREGKGLHTMRFMNAMCLRYRLLAAKPSQGHRWFGLGGSKPHRDLTRTATPDFPGEMVQNLRAWRRIEAVRLTVRSPARHFFAAPSEYWRAGG